MICTLFGAKIKLGICKVFVVNLLPCDLEEVKKQADTFMVGDRRQLTMSDINRYQMDQRTQSIDIVRDNSLVFVICCWNVWEATDCSWAASNGRIDNLWIRS